jgi:small-conductance mechanosensitive channel
MPFDLDIQDEMFQRVLLVLAVSVAVVILVKIGQRVAKKYISEPARLYHTSRFLSRTGGVVIAVILLSALSPGLGDLVTILTVIGAGLAIAMREVLLNLAGWLYITLMSAYKQGERIEINNIHGDVVDIRLMRTTVMEIRGWVDADQSTGRLTHLPNGWVLMHATYNYSRGFKFIWNELSITLTFRSDWEKARDIMAELAEESAVLVEQQAAAEIRQMSREFLVHYSILTPFVYVRVVDNGVRLTLRYLCDVRKRRGTEHAITVSILHAFKQTENIEFAYPALNLARYDGPQFGPPDAKGGRA